MQAIAAKLAPMLRPAAALVVGVGDFVIRAYRAVARFHHRRRFLACGEDVLFDPLSSTIDYEQVRVGSRVYIGPGATLGRADIGDDVMLGPNVAIRDGYHGYDVVGRAVRDSGDARSGPGRVVVGNDVWIGEGAVLLRRTRVGDGAVIGTKAMVNGPVPPYTIMAGSPAEPIGPRFSDDQLREHLRLRGLPPAAVEAVVEERRRAGIPGTAG
jgi:acetyltransferase-like isoleucine patch superfamily enzyme